MTKSFSAPFFIAVIVCSSALAGTVHFAWSGSLVSVAIYPPSASINVGESVWFNSTVTGATTPYRYQWYLNDSALIGATSASWTFSPPSKGTYGVYLKILPLINENPAVNDSTGKLGQSQTARIVVGKQSLAGSFGYPYPSSQNSGSGTKFTVDGSRFTLNVAANVTSMSCLMTYTPAPYDVNQNCTYKFAIYRDNNGQAGSLVAQTAQGTISYTDRDVPLWYTLDFSSVAHLTPAAYWLVAVHNASQFIGTCSSVVAAYQSVSSFIGGMNFPSSLPSPIYTANYVYSMFASWEANFSASLTEDRRDLAVTSNSTVSPLAYDSTAQRLSFTVNGSSGTTGYSEVFVSKASLLDVVGVRVTLDGRELNFTSESLDDSWVLYFVYSHSTHNVAVNMQLNVIPEFPDLLLVALLAMTLTTLTCLGYPIKKTARVKTRCPVR